MTTASGTLEQVGRSQSIVSNQLNSVEGQIKSSQYGSFVQRFEVRSVRLFCLDACDPSACSLCSCSDCGVTIKLTIASEKLTATQMDQIKSTIATDMQVSSDAVELTIGTFTDIEGDRSQRRLTNVLVEATINAPSRVEAQRVRTRAMASQNAIGSSIAQETGLSSEITQVTGGESTGGDTGGGSGSGSGSGDGNTGGGSSDSSAGSGGNGGDKDGNPSAGTIAGIVGSIVAGVVVVAIVGIVLRNHMGGRQASANVLFKEESGYTNAEMVVVRDLRALPRQHVDIPADATIATNPMVSRAERLAAMGRARQNMDEMAIPAGGVAP